MKPAEAMKSLKEPQNQQNIALHFVPKVEAIFETTLTVIFAQLPVESINFIVDSVHFPLECPPLGVN